MKSRSRTRINDSGAIVGTATYTGTNTAIANGSHGVVLCPVAVVSDPSNTYYADQTNPVLTWVQFGLWDSAFSTVSPPPAPYTATLATPTLNNGNDSSGQANFVGADSKRFYLRVYDPSAIGNPAVVQTVTASWFTQSSGAMDDDGNLQGQPPGIDTVTLTETAAGSGLFASKALMLVSDDVDNAQPTNTGLQGAGGATAGIGVADHRLRRAALTDTMGFSYTPAATGSTKQTFSLPLFGGAEPVKNITVHFVVTKGSGVNSQEFGADVQTMETNLLARFAVAGIQPHFIYNPANDLLDLRPLNLNLLLLASNGLPGSQLFSIAQSLRSKYGNYNPTDPTIWVIVIGGFQASVAGLSFTDGIEQAALNAGQITNIHQMDPILHCAFVAQAPGFPSSPMLGISAFPMLAPHEIGHHLSDRIASDAGSFGNLYVGNNLRQNLMGFPADDGTQVIDAKRLWNDQSHNTDPLSTPKGQDHQIDYMRQSPLCH